MARPLNPVKKVADATANVVVKVLGGVASFFQGRPSIAVEKLDRIGSGARLLAEHPSRDFEEYYFVHDVMANSPAINAAVTKMSEDATLDENGDAVGLGVQIKVEPLDSENEESVKTARSFKRELVAKVEDFILRTGIGYNAKHYIRKILYAGDCFGENHINLDSETGLGRVERIKELPTFQMFIIWNERGELVAYEQRQFRTDKHPVRWDVPAQIIHWKHAACDYLKLGRSVLSEYKTRWESFKIIEMDLIAAIHTRSVSPEVHYLGRKIGLDNVSDDAIDEYHQKLTDNAADTRRYYVVREGQTRIEFPNTGDAQALKVLMDIHRAFERAFVEALGVPGIFAGEQATTKRRVASSLEQDYARRINSIRQDFSVGLRPVIYLDLALQGYDLSPEGLQTKHKVKRVTISPLWPDLGETRTQKAARLALQFAAGMKSLETCLREEGNQDPEGEIDIMLAERKRGIYAVAFAPHENPVTPNGSQGRGVASDEGGSNQAAKPDKPSKQAVVQAVLEQQTKLIEAMLEL